MHVVIRKPKLSGSAEEAARRARDHSLPLVQGRPGPTAPNPPAYVSH